MKTPPSKRRAYWAKVPLTIYDRNLLAAIAQGWSFERARHVEGQHQGVSAQQARNRAYVALMKLKMDFDAPDAKAMTITTWCYRNAYWIERKVGLKPFKHIPHRNHKPNRQDKDLYLEVLKLALEGVPRAEIPAKVKIGVNAMNTALAFWRRLLCDVYLTPKEQYLRQRYWPEWLRLLGYDRSKEVLRRLTVDWRPKERAEDFYKRMTK